MANYYCVTRTNYFHVKDPDAFREYMKGVSASEDAVRVWEEKKNDGDTVFGFGCYGAINGVGVGKPDQDGYYDEYDYDEFVNGLSELVAEDDAIIIVETGAEKLRYLYGGAMVITSKGTDYLSIETVAAESAAKLLGNAQWKTEMWY